MANCPNCKHIIEEDFGLVECSGCHISLLIGFDGEIQVAKKEAMSPAIEPVISSVESSIHSTNSKTNVSASYSSQVEEVSEEVTNFDFPLEEQIVESPSINSNVQSLEPFEGLSSPEHLDLDKPVLGPFTSTQKSVVNEGDDLSSAFSEASVVSEEVFEPSMASGSVIVSSVVSDSVIEPLNDENTNFLAEEEILKARIKEPQNEMSDISEFSNSTQSSLQDGYIKYKIYLGGLEDSEIKKMVFDELSDKKLLLGAHDLLQSIGHDGQLCIDSLSAIKASIIINRLKSLGVKIAWDQYDIRKV